MTESKQVSTELSRRAADLAPVMLSPHSLMDLEMLAVGGFSPLHRFLGQRDYQSVIERGRLADGRLFPVPVVLAVTDPGELRIGQEVSLRNARNNLIAWMRIEEIFEREEQPAGAAERYCLSGEMKVVELPPRYDFPELRLSPAQVRERLRACGNEAVLAFQSLRPADCAAEEMTKRAAAELNATLLLQPLTALPGDGGIDYYARLRAWKTVVHRYYDPASTLLNLIPLRIPGAGGRAALLQALVARNYGATHLLLNGEFAEAKSAARLLEAHASELGITGIVGESIPGSSAARPEVAEILAAAHPPRAQQGFCLWLTGLPSAGKSTIAEVLSNLLLEQGRQVTLLDGDVVRTHLSRGLGFSREDRDANILRIGFVASEIVRHRGVVICAAVSPYQAARDRVRQMIPAGQFLEIFVNTPLSVCEQRDVKGYYARARAGHIKAFTGVDDPYEPPPAPEIALDTVSSSPAANARLVVAHLASQGFLE
jgi:sulfate adenylyltransferase